MVVLSSRNLDLYEIQDEHVPQLFLWRNEDDFMTLCSTRRNRVSLQEFEAELRMDLSRDRHCQFMVVKRGKRIGTVFSYGLNRTDGHAFVTIYFPRKWRRKGYGAEAMVALLEYLFRECQLYKVYAEVYAYNSESLDALRTAGFIEEGRFHGHRLHSGERFDLVRFALFRTQFNDAAATVRRLIARPVGYKRNRGSYT